MNTRELIGVLREKRSGVAPPTNARPNIIHALFKQSMDECGACSSCGSSGSCSCDSGSDAECAGLPETVTEDELKARAASAPSGPEGGSEGGMGMTAKSSGRTFLYIGEAFAARIQALR